jgi:predicted Zn-dependent peptidase
MNKEEYIKELNNEISKLKEKLLLTENELDETKHKLNTYQINSKKYYENNKDKIIERVKNYNKQNNYKPIVSCDKL